MKLALLIPDGAGVRNFLIGPFLRHAAAQGSVTVFHQVPEELAPLYEPAGVSVAWQPLAPLADTPLTLVLRNALAFAHMHWADTTSMRYALRTKFGGSWRTRSAMRAARFAGRVSASQRRIRRLDQYHAAIVGRSAQVRHYCRVFQELRPSMLFCSNQRAGAAVPAVLAAKKLGIPSNTTWSGASSCGRN
jgi:hypothetical protein